MKTPECIPPLVRAGIDPVDARALRRIAMQLQRWHELECGDSNDYGSWAIERDGNEPDSKPYLVHHHYLHGRGADYTTRTPIPDREMGARKRLAKIMSRYPTLKSYVQGDPRGAALYILRPGDVPAGESVNAYYSRGIAVYR